MRALSSAVSVGTHVAIVLAALLVTARRPMNAGSRVPPPIIVWPSTPNLEGVPTPVPAVQIGPVPRIAPDLHVPPIDLPKILPQPGAAVSGTGSPEPPSASNYTLGVGSSAGWSPFGETTPEILSAPLPRYPDLLRQAGIQGRVVLEAVVETTGRVQRESIEVAEATNPAFVNAAREALLGTLFRPAAVNGHAVRVKIRIPYEFTLKNGTSHAR